MREVQEHERILGKYPEQTGRGVRVAGLKETKKHPDGRFSSFQVAGRGFLGPSSEGRRTQDLQVMSSNPTR